MSANLSLKPKNIKLLLKKLTVKYARHMVFGAIIIVLLAYLLVVFRISSLAKAEPSADQQGTITSSIPKIDKNAVNQIQSLEQNNTQIHSLFESARNNPFQE